MLGDLDGEVRVNGILVSNGTDSGSKSEEVTEKLNDVDETSEDRVKREVEKTTRMLEEIGTMLSTAEQNLDSGVAGAVDTVAVIDEKIEVRIDEIEDDSGGFDGFGGF